MDHDRFFQVLAEGFGVDARDVQLVLVDSVGGASATGRTAGGDAFAFGHRLGTLARLLSAGEDWEVATSATGFALEARSAVGATCRLMVELGATLLPLDLFTVASDPLGAVARLFRDAGGGL